MPTGLDEMGGWGRGREGRREKATIEGRGGHTEKREGGDRQTDRQTDRQRNRETETWRDRDIERQTDRQRWETQRKRKRCPFFFPPIKNNN